MPLRFLTAIVLVFICMAQSHAALDMMKGKKEEKPVYAFFRLIKQFPDFDYWAAHLVKLKKGEKDEERIKEFERVRTRLKWGFGTYNEKNEFLKIETPVVLRFQDQGAGQYHLTFELTQRPPYEITLFTYPYGSQVIALFAEDLGRFENLPVKAENYARYQKLFGGETSLEATLKLHIRPLKADASKPVKIANINHWLLSGDIAYFGYEIINKIEGGRKEIMVEHAADWYDPKRDEQGFVLSE